MPLRSRAHRQQEEDLIKDEYMHILIDMKASTPLTVDEDVWRMFRAECIRRGTSASKLIQEFMRMSLRRWEVDMEKLPKRQQG